MRFRVLLFVVVLGGAAWADSDPLAADVRGYLRDEGTPEHLLASHVRLHDLVAEVEDSARAAEVRVVESALGEETPVGPYGQPEWTTKRRFLTTRAYVLPQGTVELETWWRGKWPDGSGPEHRFQQEIAVGLPHRFQIDLYETLERPSGGPLDHAAVQAEVRWAVANWGEIPLNPTLYAEWVFVDQGSDKWEVKLLLADELGPRWHWAGNLIFEQEVSGEKEREIAISQGVSYTLLDQRFAVGAELVVEQVSVAGARGDPEYEVLFGPSFEWRPTARTHISIVPLFGLTDDSPTVEAFIVFSFQLTKPAAPTFGRSPTSLRSR